MTSSRSQVTRFLFSLVMEYTIYKQNKSYKSQTCPIKCHFLFQNTTIAFLVLELLLLFVRAILKENPHNSHLPEAHNATCKVHRHKWILSSCKLLLFSNGWIFQHLVTCALFKLTDLTQCCACYEYDHLMFYVKYQSFFSIWRLKY